MENDPLYGHDPYSASKVSTEAVVSGYRSIFERNNTFAPILALRAGNVIGGGDWAANRLLPDLIRAFSSNQPSVELRHPHSTRPWQHALDPLWGYLLAIDKSLNKKEHNEYNFGPNDANLSVIGVAKLAADRWKYQGSIIDLQNPGPYESKFLNLNSTKAETELGWTPVWNQQESVLQTVDWWKDFHLGGMSATELISRDINYFLGVKHSLKAID